MTQEKKGGEALFDIFFLVDWARRLTTGICCCAHEVVDKLVDNGNNFALSTRRSSASDTTRSVADKEIGLNPRR